MKRRNTSEEMNLSFPDRRKAIEGNKQRVLCIVASSNQIQRKSLLFLVPI